MNIDATQSTSVLDQFARAPEPQTSGSNELGKDEFMKLLVTQMENQNPLEPQDNGEFIAQLAQFSSLEGIDNLNDTMSGFVNSFQSNQALEASMLVGRQVQVQTDTAWMQQGEPFSGVIELPSSSPSVRVSIYDESGTLVRNLDLGSRSGGDLDFLWNGTDSSGNVLPSGNYTIKAEAQLDGEAQQLNTLLGANVNSVTLGAGGTGMTLNLAGIGKVSMSDVRTIQ